MWIFSDAFMSYRLRLAEMAEVEDVDYEEVEDDNDVLAEDYDD